MARTPYPDPDAESAYQDIVAQSSKPLAYISDAADNASGGGRSNVEITNPNLRGPTDREVDDRKKDYERQKARNRR